MELCPKRQNAFVSLFRLSWKGTGVVSRKTHLETTRAWHRLKKSIKEEGNSDDEPDNGRLAGLPFDELPSVIRVLRGGSLSYDGMRSKSGKQLGETSNNDYLFSWKA